MEIVGCAEPDLVAEVERLKAKGYQGVKPGDCLAKYLDPMKDLDWSAEKVKMRKAWMNNPNTLPRLRKQLAELRRQMEVNKASMGKALSEASREKYYKAIG